jgi:transcriptional regulator with XRE-family HTH domain
LPTGYLVSAPTARHAVDNLDLFAGLGILDHVPDVDGAVDAAVGSGKPLQCGVVGLYGLDATSMGELISREDLGVISAPDGARLHLVHKRLLMGQAPGWTAKNTRGAILCQQLYYPTTLTFVQMLRYTVAEINLEVWMDRIRQLRKERGLSQAKLAVMADMDPATLNRLEQGKGNPNLKTLERVASALGVEVVDLFPKRQSGSSLEPSLLNGLEEERRVPDLQGWTALATCFADRWEEEIEKQAQAAEPNLDWAKEIDQTAAELTATAGDALELALGVSTTPDALDLFRALERLHKVVSRVSSWSNATVDFEAYKHQRGERLRELQEIA